MSRPVREGDLVIVNVNNQRYPLVINRISTEGIHAGNYLIVSKWGVWQVSNYTLPHSLSFHFGPQPKVATLNLGYNVMANKLAGSEAPLVKLCQSTYGGGWKDPSQQISACTYNAAELLSNYNLFGLQEVHPSYRQKLEETIRRLNPSADYGFISGPGILTGFDKNVTGEGVQVTPDGHLLGDRGMQVVWFPRLSLLFINLHAPHDLDLKREIEANLSTVGVNLGKINADRVIMVGDFNDWQGNLLNQSIDLFGHQLRTPTSTPILTCCADSGYTYPGDYILVSDYRGEHYGYPEGYIRGQPPISDHDPLVLIPREKRVYSGRVKISGENTEILLSGVDPDSLFREAQDYITEKKLGWNINKPRAWSKPGSGPHVTLVPAMRRYLGTTVNIELGHLTHFIDGKTRWVTYDVKTSPQLDCGYPCHLSVGQQDT